MRKTLCTLATIAAVALTAQADAGFLLDNGSIANGSGRTVSGTNISGGFEVFQPFTVPAGGWFVTTIGTDGWEVTDPTGGGMLGSLMPDDGAGNPNEGAVIQTETFQLSTDPFNSNWDDEAFNVGLPAGDYWMRWSPNDRVNAWFAIFAGVSGELSFSRQMSTGNIFPDGVTALRIDGTLLPAPAGVLFFGLAGLAGTRRRK